ncbi:MAG: hypothetical protein KA369_05345 [Spirochaetes bacterium]|nr:hypothetical protein [Spirochaetota bacterium]
MRRSLGFCIIVCSSGRRAGEIIMFHLDGQYYFDKKKLAIEPESTGTERR